MVPTAIRISFRYKRGSRGAVKVFTTMRVDGLRNPRQLHLGYVPVGATLSEHHFARLEDKLKAGREHYKRHKFVVINREDAMAKWGRLGQPRRAPIDRAVARAQLKLWLEDPGKPTLPAFGGITCQTHQLDSVYEEFYLSSYVRIIARSPALDPAHFAQWWENMELPRLLHRYHAYVHRKKNYHFCRGGFVRFAAFNAAQGFALKQYIRENDVARESAIVTKFGDLAFDYIY